MFFSLLYTLLVSSVKFLYITLCAPANLLFAYFTTLFPNTVMAVNRVSFILGSNNNNIDCHLVHVSCWICTVDDSIPMDERKRRFSFRQKYKSGVAVTALNQYSSCVVSILSALWVHWQHCEYLFENTLTCLWIHWTICEHLHLFTSILILLWVHWPWCECMDTIVRAQADVYTPDSLLPYLLISWFTCFSIHWSHYDHIDLIVSSLTNDSSSIKPSSNE